MDKFSNKYSKLEKTKHLKLISCLNAYAHYFYENKYELIKLPTGNIGICARVSLQAGSNSILIQHEPIIIEICGNNLEKCDINVYPDRLNFPFDNFPHINFAVGKLPPSLCLTRDSFVNWYAEHSFGDFLELIYQWFNDALKENLIKKNTEDFYEPFRVDDSNIFLFKIPIEDSYLEKFNCCGNIIYKVDSYGNNIYGRECNLIEASHQDVGVLLYKSHDLVCKTWFIERPKTLGELFTFCSENNFEIDNTVLQQAINSNSHAKDIFFQFAFTRPVNILGKNSKIDYLTFRTSVEGYISQKMSSKVHSVQMIDFATPQLANYLSNTTTSIAGKKILILGCGAIGSKLVYHLYRSGICNLTICDYDYFLSHNVCRHAITKHGFMDLKVQLIKNELDSMFKMNDKKVKIISKDILQWLPSINLSEYDMIIDATASASVFRLVDELSYETSTTIVHYALSDAGNVGHVYVNTNRRTKISDYYMYIAKESITDDDISNWLEKESRYNLDLVRIGEGCHSNTMRLGDDIISTHTGIAASIIKCVLAKESQNMVYLSYTNIEYDGQVFTEKIQIPDFFTIQCSNDSKWQIRIPNPLLERIKINTKIAGKKEVGGYLMGNIDIKHKIIYVLHQYKPSNSKQSCSGLILGTKGWNKEYINIKKRSSGILDYIGDWHSHPFGSLEMSLTDISTNYTIKTNEISSDYGLCLITNSNQTKAYLLTNVPQDCFPHR